MCKRPCRVARPEVGAGIVDTVKQNKAPPPHQPTQIKQEKTLPPKQLPESTPTPPLITSPERARRPGRESPGKVGAGTGRCGSRPASPSLQVGACGRRREAGVYLRRSGVGWTSCPPCRGCSPSQASPASSPAPRPRCGKPRTARGRTARRPRPRRSRRPRPRRRSGDQT